MRISSILVTTTLLMFPAVLVTAEGYHSSTYGYSLDLPSSWVQIPQDKVEEMLTEGILLALVEYGPEAVDVLSSQNPLPCNV